MDKPGLWGIKLESARCLTEGLYHPLRWECWQKDLGDEPQKSDGVDKRGVLSGPVHQHSHTGLLAGQGLENEMLICPYFKFK